MPEITEKYIRIPTGINCEITATITISSNEGIKALYCSKVKKIRTYLFLKSKGWTMVKAKEWVKNHKSSLEERKLIMNTPNKFKISLPIEKTRIRLVKSEKGNEVEEKFVTGVASSTDKDVRNDSMTPECLQTMADSLKQHILNLNAEHDTSWQSELGSLEKLEVNKQDQLVMEAKLNKMSKSKDLWYALTELHKKLGLSIGGYVKEYEMVKEGEGEDAEWTRVFKNIELDHIAVTSSPANPKTWVDVITKSLDPEKEKLMKETIINKNEKKTFSYLIENSKTVNVKEYAKEALKDLKQERLLKFINGIFDELDESQLLKMIKRSFFMAKEKEEIKKEEKKIEKEDIKKEEKKTEDTAKTEKKEEVKKEEKKEPEKVKKEEVKKDKIEPEKVKKEEVKKEEVKKTGDDEKEQGSNKKVEVKEKVEKSENEILKAVTGVAVELKALTEANQGLVQRLEKLEKQPAGRKVAIEKTIGGEDSDKVDTSEKAMEKKIADLKKNHPNDPTLFSKIQKIREEYK